MNDWAEFRHFLYLKTILERGGFRSAADHLNTSQPNLTVQARQFQDFADIRLYRKAKDGRISPTDTGLAFISLASSVLEIRDEVIAALIAIDRGEIPSVRLGCSPLVDQEVFRVFCSMHRDLLPRCSVRPTHGDICLGGLIFAGIRMMSGRFSEAVPGLVGALFGAGVLGWGAGWIGSLTGQSM